LLKIAAVHGKKHPELPEISDLFHASAKELSAHMKKEELVLFPYIKKLAVSLKSGIKYESSIFKSVENPIVLMLHEHETEGDRFRKIESLSNNYTISEDGCNTYRVAFSMLKELQEDLHLHIHL
jgi:regulator of cell morphogenesis and NO signaling